MLNQVAPYIDALVALITTVGAYMLTSFNKWLRIYFFLPMSLLWVHAAGSIFQSIDYGSEWTQNHMHNIGIPAYGMMALMIFASRIMDRELRTSTVSALHAGAKSIMTCAVVGWMIGAAYGTAHEIADVTIFREDNVQQDYSGQLDWLDITSYVVGAMLVYLNHRKLSPIVLRNAVRANRRR